MTRKSPLISIIMPTYNREYIIGQAIESVLEQTFQNWELIIVDDESTDNTRSLVEAIDDPRVKYYKQKNQGPSAARNKGIGVSQGIWITYLDSDDVMYPKYLQVMIEQLDKSSDAVFAICRNDRIISLHKNGKMIKSLDHSIDMPRNIKISDIFMKTFHFSCNGFVHRKDIICGDIMWDEKLWQMEEWDLAMSIGKKYPEGFLYIPEVLCKYSQRHGADGIASNTKYSDWAKAFKYIHEKHRNSHLLKGQSWYPQRVEKWNKVDSDFKKGIAPPPHLYYFSEYSKNDAAVALNRSHAIQ